MKYTDLPWRDYDQLRLMPDAKREQIRNLIGTGLCEGPDDGEYCFMPTSDLKIYEDSSLDSYEKIRIADHKIELCNEIYYTSKIEGANTTIARTVEIHDGAPVDRDNYFSEMMVRSGFEATKYLNLRANRLNEDILINMWNILVEGCCENQSIRGEKYRTGHVQVGNISGLKPDFIQGAMDSWLDFYNSGELNDHPFIKASLLHVAYERIHPFCDGNGRSGRLLMVNYLIGQGFEKCKAISFSRRIAEDYNAYYTALARCNNSYLDCTPFIQYMSALFANTFLDVLEHAQTITGQDTNGVMSGQDGNIGSVNNPDKDAGNSPKSRDYGTDITWDTLETACGYDAGEFDHAEGDMLKSQQNKGVSNAFWVDAGQERHNYDSTEGYDPGDDE